MDKAQIFEGITGEMLELYKRKSHDYGDSTSDTYAKYGLVSYLVRMQDKINRLSALLKSGAKVEESVEDTLIDLANYSVLALMDVRK